MRSRRRSRSFRCKLIDVKGFVQVCGLAQDLLCSCVTEISVATKGLFIRHGYCSPIHGGITAQTHQTEKLPNGMLTTDKILIAVAAPRNTKQ
jgi:hypothetical protein